MTSIFLLRKLVIRVVLLLPIGLFASCYEYKERKAAREEKQVRFKKTIDELKLYQNKLLQEKKEAQSFIETAEVHQVLRSQEEKEHQLDNLNLYKEKIDLKLDSLQNVITAYADSIRWIK